MLDQSNYIKYNKIEQCLIGIRSDCYQWEACEISICKFWNIKWSWWIYNELRSFEGQSTCREMCQLCMVTNEGVQKKVDGRGLKQIWWHCGLEEEVEKDGKERWWLLLFNGSHFLLNWCILRSVSNQSFGCWLPYDVEKVVILKNVSFFVVEYYKDYIEYCKR